MPKKKPKMKYNIKRRKRSDKLSKNHHPHLKVNLVQKKRRKRSGKRNQRKLNLLLKLILKKRKRKMSQLQLLKRQVDCKNHPALLANSAHPHKAILTTLEISEKSFKVVNKRMLKHSHSNSPKQIPPQQVNSLNHLNSSKSPMT